jgi:hypothetical protein
MQLSLPNLNHFNMTTRRPRRSSFSEPITKQLTWDIDLKPVCVEGSILPDYQSIVRNDNGQVLSLTKKTYHPASNEKFAEVIGRIHEFTGFDVEGYSVFHGGRKVLAFLKNNEKMRVGDFDSSNYMVIGNSFDRSTGFFTGISSVVIRCTNQFSRIQTTQTIRHNKQINMKLDELVRFYKDYIKQEQQLKEVFEIWNQNLIDKHTVQAFADHVLEIPNVNVSTVKKNHRLSLFDSINTEMAAMGNTAYGLFNGLTHYTSHVVKSSSKMFGNALGHSYRLNERGFRFLEKSVR